MPRIYPRRSSKAPTPPSTPTELMLPTNGIPASAATTEEIWQALRWCRSHLEIHRKKAEELQQKIIALEALLARQSPEVKLAR
jgi:hypothetical protein